MSAKVVTDSSVDIGSQRTNAMPAGETLLTDDGLGITVLSVDADAWPEVLAEASWNDPPKTGYRFLMMEVEIENISGASGQISVSASDFKAVGSLAFLRSVRAC